MQKSENFLEVNAGNATATRPALRSVDGTEEKDKFWFA